MPGTQSTGAYDDGAGEREDIAAGMEFLRQKGISVIDLAGYSFGAWMIAHFPEKSNAHGIVLVSPPAAMMDFDDSVVLPNLKMTVTGEADEFAPPGLVQNLAARWNPGAEFAVIPGADHFFFGFTDALLKILAKNK